MVSSRWRLALVLPLLTLSLAAQGAREDEDYDRPDLRETWERMRTGGEPTAAYLRWKGQVAAQELRKMRTFRPATQGLVADPAWTNLGPTGVLSTQNPASGRILAILTHPTDPKILYVATAGGGAYKCTNADLAAANWTWTPLTDALPNASANGEIAINAMAMDPSDPNILYIGMGGVNADSQLFYVSRDGGATWTQGGAMPGANYVRCITPMGGSTVLVTTHDRLWRSTDGGTTFAEVSLGSVQRVYNIQKFGPQELILAGDTVDTATSLLRGWIKYSSDGGASWTSASFDTAAANLKGDCFFLAAGSASSGTAYALAQVSDSQGSTLVKGVLKSTDKGHTWTYVPAPVAAGSLFQFDGGTDAQYPFNQLLKVDPSDASRLFAAANNALYRSLDGGQTWVQLSDWRLSDKVWMHADFHAATWSQTGTKTLFVGNDGGLCVLKDPYRATLPATTVDTTFADNTHNQGLVTHLIYNLGSSTAPTQADARSRVTLGMQDNGTWVRKDAGAGLAASTTYSTALGADGFSTLIHPLDADLVLATEQHGAVFRSTDGGDSFSPSQGLDSGNWFFTVVNPHPADPTGNTVFTFGQQGLYKSTNFGETFTLLTPTRSTSNPSAPDINNWNSFLAGAPSDINTLAMLSNPSWDGNGVNGYTSLDGGATWTAWGVPTGGMQNPASIAFDPASAQVLYVSGTNTQIPVHHHLWKSVDGGRSFVSIDGSAAASNGLPYGIPVSVVKTDPLTPNVVYAATDLGLYRSTDGGTSWARYGTGLPMVGVRDLYVAPDATFLRVATYGRGAWELKLKNPGTATAAISAPASDLTVNDGTTVSFTGTGTGTGALTYVWDFGDHTTAIGASASHRYTDPITFDVSTYTVHLYVKDSAGNLATAATRTITVNPPPDTVAPTVSVATNGSTSGYIGFSANATDNVGVSKVEFWVDGVYKGTATRGIAGLVMNFDSTTIANGPHSLVGKAYDAAGNVGTSTPVAFTVSNGPATFQEVESNNTIATANVVSTSFAAIQGNPTSTSDPDYFALTVAPGQKLTIAMTGPTGTGLDWDLYLKNASGTNLASSTGSTTTENLSWTNTGSTSVTVYANVVAYSGSSSTPYTLNLTYGSPSDTTVPTVSASESGTAGTITLSATANDNVGVTKVEFYVDGALKGTDTTSPYSVTLDSTTLANGSHTLVAKAYDGAGNSASSTSVSFSVNNPVADTTAPTVSASETGTSGTITLSATATDNTGGSGVAKVEFYVDGALKATDTTSPYSATLDSTTLADGAHTLVAKATDVAGNVGTSSSVAFSVANGGSLAQNEAESNNTTGTANVVATSGTTVTGYISSSTDTDYFQVTVPAGHTLTATLTPPANSDFDLKIYNTTSTTAIASSTNGTGQVDTASTTNTGTTSVVRYVQVKYYSGASTTQSYKLKLTF